MTRRLLPVARLLVAAAVLISGAPRMIALQQGNRRATATTLIFFEQWMHDVAAHSPGEADAIVRRIRLWTPEDRAEFGRATGFFVRGYLHKGLVGGNEVEKRLDEMGGDQEQRGGNEFLRRVALLHTDVVIVGGTAPLDKIDALSTGEDGLIVVKDGEFQGIVRGDWNWPLARTWLQMLEPDPRRDPFVATWYHATAAYMLGQGLFGEAAPHLEEAGRLFPYDARILTDSGCLAETLALPRAQGVLTDEDIVAKRIAETNRGMSPSLARAGPMARAVPIADETLTRAETLYRRAIDRDPSMAEAHLRLGRVLSLRHRYSGARKALSRALETSKDRRLLFYAHLFTARASRRMGDSA